MKVTARDFFTFTFLWSGLFWALTVIMGGIEELPGSLIFYVGGAGPIVSALFLIHIRESKQLQKEFWLSTINPGRMPVRWLLVALLIHPLLIAIAALADLALGSELVFRTQNLNDARAWIMMVLFVFILGPLPEEMGWRGIALERLQNSTSPLKANLLVGMAWSTWHIPLFFIAGTFQHQMGAGSTRFWIFLATMVPLSVIMGWVYNHTHRSILSAVLIHFTGNLCGALLAKSNQLAAFELVALLSAATYITLKQPTLGYTRKDG